MCPEAISCCYNSSGLNLAWFEIMDTNGNGCITEEEFGQLAQAGWPPFAAVAMRNGYPECISRREYWIASDCDNGSDLILNPSWFEIMDTNVDECITEEEFGQLAQAGWPPFAAVAMLDGDLF
jgi:hypothetical protein